jgi:hypothetical protein
MNRIQEIETFCWFNEREQHAFHKVFLGIKEVQHIHYCSIQ